MRMPLWFPKISRPWNPAYREVYDQMTDNEKRCSFAIDLVVVFGVCAALLLAGCQRADDAKDGATLKEHRQTQQLPIVTDEETGCQYLGYLGHGVTPRLDGFGRPMCPFVDLKLQSPVETPE